MRFPGSFQEVPGQARDGAVQVDRFRSMSAGVTGRRPGEQGRPFRPTIQAEARWLRGKPGTGGYASVTDAWVTVPPSSGSLRELPEFTVVPTGNPLPNSVVLTSEPSGRSNVVL